MYLLIHYLLIHYDYNYHYEEFFFGHWVFWEICVHLPLMWYVVFCRADSSNADEDELSDPNISPDSTFSGEYICVTFYSLLCCYNLLCMQTSCYTKQNVA